MAWGMCDNHIKEEVSVNYIKSVASKNWYCVWATTTTDYWTDMCVEEINYQGEEQYWLKRRTTWKKIDLQLKATGDNTVRMLADGATLSYDLEINTYNHLISRMTSSPVPLYLILFVGPDDLSEWVTINTDEVSIKKHAYWYRPDDTATILPAGTWSSRTAIRIPLSQKITSDTFEEFIQLHYS